MRVQRNTALRGLRACVSKCIQIELQKEILCRPFLSMSSDSVLVFDGPTDVSVDDLLRLVQEDDDDAAPERLVRAPKRRRRTQPAPCAEGSRGIVAILGDHRGEAVWYDRVKDTVFARHNALRNRHDWPVGGQSLLLGLVVTVAWLFRAAGADREPDAELVVQALRRQRRYAICKGYVENPVLATAVLVQPVVMDADVTSKLVEACCREALSQGMFRVADEVLSYEMLRQRWLSVHHVDRCFRQCVFPGPLAECIVHGKWSVLSMLPLTRRSRRRLSFLSGRAVQSSSLTVSCSGRP